ncbi:hypothetical protein F751_3171 [Auxenochlorella protothecoides]|uniref:Uncharacterized protein n=1 Tax=Auxenochlorella protothecoides TaxID=3075 RepID=A0A087SFE9_AUXPR|nr:hypothetical protein F751_3171 [Auxenochlorella protothecoides]KFM24453.1 hypothetical protein F751_3171 [Auxenochlorella protothecoides]
MHGMSVSILFSGPCKLPHVLPERGVGFVWVRISSMYLPVSTYSSCKPTL